MSTLKLASLPNLGTSVPKDMADVDVTPTNFENPLVHGADTGAMGSSSALTWTSKSTNRPGHLAGLGAWNRGTAVNFNASSQFKTAPPISGR
jgi:hypothetical protein